MLSHCVPDPMGTADRARAWQMLRLAGQTHQVHLACLMDEPVHMDQWRHVDSQAKTIVIEATSANQQWLSRLIETVNPNRADQICMTHVLRHHVRAMRRDHRFDAVLCTHPGLWSLAERVRANVRVCDLYTPASLIHHISAEQTKNPATRWRQTQLAQHRLKIEQYIARRTDILCVNSELAQQPFLNHHAKAIVVPDAVDLGYFKLPIHDQMPPAPQVVLHGNWHSRSFRHAKNWFTEQVWPQIQSAVPKAVLQCSGPALSPATIHRLSDASVIVSSMTKRSQGIWPTLQAMAMARPVIAPERSLGNLEVRHGEHMLIPRFKKDWVDLCVDSLRSTAMRLQLARGGRGFVQEHCPIEQTGAALSFALAKHVNQIPAFAKAA